MPRAFRWFALCLAVSQPVPSRRAWTGDDKALAGCLQSEPMEISCSLSYSVPAPLDAIPSDINLFIQTRFWQPFCSKTEILERLTLLIWFGLEAGLCLLDCWSLIRVPRRPEDKSFPSAWPAVQCIRASMGVCHKDGGHPGRPVTSVLESAWGPRFWDWTAWFPASEILNLFVPQFPHL